MKRSPPPLTRPATTAASGATASGADSHELLSRLADGDCDGSVAPQACARWAAEAGARETWHCYQLIGDVMRSDELRPSAQGDAAFLAALRLRLAHEPAVVAPRALAGVSTRRVALGAHRRWVVPTALLAGVVAVAGVTVVMRGLQAGDAAGGAAHLASPVQPSELTSATVVSSNTETRAMMIRDARLDRYLQAHHGMRIGATAALPGGGMRNVDMLVPAR